MTSSNYPEAVVRVVSRTGPVEVRSAPVSEVSGPFPDPAGRTIHIITAHNPNGRRQSDAANAKAHGRLLAALYERRLEHWDAVGGDDSWTHLVQSVAVVGISEVDALAIGREFSQEAVLGWRPQNW